MSAVNAYSVGCRCQACLRAEIGRIQAALIALEASPESDAAPSREQMRLESSSAKIAAQLTDRIDDASVSAQHGRLAKLVRASERAQQQSRERAEAPLRRRAEMAVREFHCPTCGAQAGTPCTGPRPQAGKPHASRLAKVPPKARPIRIVSAGGFETNRRRH
jgi:hypothetical protein